MTGTAASAIDKPLTPHARPVAFIAAAAMWLVPEAALANDVAFGGAGADLVPMAETRIQLLSEDILLERLAPGGYRILGDGHWQVHATYRFRNLSPEPVRIRMGFPEPACPEDGDCSFTGFESMRTSVRGEPTELTTGGVDSEHPWAEHIDKVHLFEVTFAPGETVEVVHDYLHGLTEHVSGGEDLAYITRTGALWAGTIENASFRIRLPFRPWGVSFGPWGPRLTALTETLSEAHSQVELTFEWSDWEPEHDLRFYLGPGYPTLESPALLSGCPPHAEVFSSAVALDAIDPAGLKQIKHGISRQQLRICRNAIFAHHGREFADAKLNDFFYGERGLQLTASDDAGPPGGTVFAVNPEFSPGLLSDPEWAYVKALELAEKEQ